MPALVPESVQLERLSVIADGRYTFGRIGEYAGNKTRYLCTCLVDGNEWDAKLANLLNGRGCPECRRATQKEQGKVSEVDQVASLAATVGDRYAFSKVGEYAGFLTEYTCECRVCSHEWRSYADKMNQGRGCPRCATLVRASASALSSIKSSSPQVEEVARLAAGRFSVSMVGEYSGTRVTRYECKCFGCGHKWRPVHRVLMRGAGCPSCIECGYNPGKPGSLYALMAACGSMVKFGISNKPEQRLKTLARETPFKWEWVAQIDSQDGAQIARFEKELHAMTEQAITNASFDGYTEWRTFTPEIMETFARMTSEAI